MAGDQDRGNPRVDTRCHVDRDRTAVGGDPDFAHRVKADRLAAIALNGRGAIAMLYSRYDTALRPVSRDMVARPEADVDIRFAFRSEPLAERDLGTHAETVECVFIPIPCSDRLVHLLSCPP
jgi:hypothetical protein